MNFIIFCFNFVIHFFSLVICLPLSSVTGSHNRVLLPQRQALHAARTFTSRSLDYDDLVPIGKGGVIASNKSLAVLNASQKDYDPVLSKGIQGNPGMKIRVNQKSFDYFTTIFAPIIEQEIQRSRIPPTIECITKLNGCIQIYNAYISHYRCPQKINIYPQSPYKVVVSIENLGMGITGNVIGEFNVIIPVKVSGILHVTAQQVSATIQLGIFQSGRGAPYVQVVDCQVVVGFLDAYLEDGGIVGAIANREFRHQMNQQIRSRIPSKICERIPEAINNKLNKKLKDIPQTIALLELLQLINGAFALGNGPNVCEKRKHCTAVEEELSSLNETKILHDTPVIDDETDADLLGPRFVPLPRPTILSGSTVKNYVVLAKSRQRFVTKNEEVPSFLAQSDDIGVNLEAIPPRPNIVFINAPEPKLNCIELPPVSNSFCRVRRFIDKLDITRLQGSLLTTHLLQTFASSNDYTIAINGEVSQFGRGGTPFGAFSIDFPVKKSTKMIEFLVSDYTLNSLFYLMHQKNFISFWFDSKSPKIGSLLRTSCAEDVDDQESIVEENSEEIKDTVNNKARSSLSSIPRSRRQAETVDAFEDLGLCFGDLFPLVRKNHPNQNVSVHIYTKRAPSILLHKDPRASADINMVLLGDIFVNERGEKVGTLLLETTINLNFAIKNQRINGYSNVLDFKLTNPGETLGVPQAALSKLGDIGKQFFITALNEALEKGVKIKIPSAKDNSLPFNIIDLKFDIVEHAIYFAFDFIVSPSIISKLVGDIANKDSCLKV